MAGFDYIKSNYEALREELRLLALRLNRPEATLVAVTKSGSDEELMAIAALSGDIAENRPGELVRRGALMRDAGYSPRLHQIGSLQRNKVRLIIKDVFLIHSLDSLRLAKEIDKEAVKCGRRIPVLIEINSAREESKGGVLPEEAEEFFLSLRGLSGIAVSGIMTMGPADGTARECFRETKKIFDGIQARYGFDTDEPILSMGMSDSYVEAIEEGATMVRIGHRLFTKNEGEQGNV